MFKAFIWQCSLKALSVLILLEPFRHIKLYFVIWFALIKRKTCNSTLNKINVCIPWIFSIIWRYLTGQALSANLPYYCSCLCRIHLSIRSFIKGQTSGTFNDNEWYNEWQKMTTSDNEWQRWIQRVTTSGTTSDNEWKRMTMSDKEWQRGTISANFSFFQIREEPTTKHPKDNSLNIVEDLRRRPIELRAEVSL